MLCRLYSNQAQRKKVKPAKVLWNAHPWLCCLSNFISGMTLSEEKASGLYEELEIDMFWTFVKTFQEGKQ